MSIDKIVSEINNRKSFLITTHMNPEGDAIGSSLALAIGLESIGKKVSLYNADPVPRMLKFLPFSNRVQQISDIKEQFDAIIVVDCGDLERVGFLSADKIPAAVLLNIDHHITNTNFGTVNFVKESVAAADLVYQILKKLNVSISLEIATCIYVAILTETGSFRYSNTDHHTFRMAEEMVRMGVNPWKVAEHIYNRSSMGRIRLLGLILSNLCVSDDGRIAWITVRENMYEETGTTKEDVEDIINFPRSIEGVEVAILFRESNRDWKISLRSNGRVDVANLALEFGGGGHSMAAGFFMKGNLDDVRKNVTERVSREVEKL